MLFRILHVNNEDPWLNCKFLKDHFGLTNPALDKIERLVFQNALSLIENVGWVVGKVYEKEDSISILFVKNEECI